MRTARDTEDSEFLDLVDFGDVAFPVETVIQGAPVRHPPGSYLLRTAKVRDLFSRVSVLRRKNDCIFFRANGILWVYSQRLRMVNSYR